MSTTVCGQRRPPARGGEVSVDDLLHDRARDLRAAEFARLLRRFAAWVKGEGIVSRTHSEKADPTPRPYSSAYF